MSTDTIVVAIKSRPLHKNEFKDGPQWKIEGRTICPTNDINGFINPYVFDHIFDENCNNEIVYNAVVKPLVYSSLIGFSSTIFAYGQTSSGKTHTMMGNHKEPGIITLAANNIFQYIEEHSEKQFHIRCSFYELYNEQLNDLLLLSNRSLPIKEDMQGYWYIEASEVVVNNSNELISALKKGVKNRKTGATTMNHKSSRSHSIFKIHIESKEPESDSLQVSHLNLVDLAGSERVSRTHATGSTYKEGVNINKSLSVLGNVIRQLSENESKAFISYRDSKLTKILRHSLGGDAKCVVIATVTLAAYEETKSTFEFAQRAKTVKNRPKLNKLISQEDKNKGFNINQLRDAEATIKKLKEELDWYMKLKSDAQTLMACNMNKPTATNRRHTISSYDISRDLPLSNNSAHNGGSDLQQIVEDIELDLNFSINTNVEVGSDRTTICSQYSETKNCFSPANSDIFMEVDNLVAVEKVDAQVSPLSAATTPRFLLKQRLESLNKSYDELSNFIPLETNILYDEKIMDLQNEIETLKKRLCDQEESKMLQVERDSEKWSCLETENDNLRSLIKDYDIVIDENKSLKIEIENYKHQMKSIQERNDSLDRKLFEQNLLLQENEKLKNEINKYRNAVETREKLKTEPENCQIKQLKSELEESKKIIEEYDRQVFELYDQIEQLEKEHINKGEITSILFDLYNLQNTIQSFGTSVDQNGDLKAQNVKLEQKITALNHNLSHKTEQLNEKTTLIMNLQEKLKVNQTDLEKLKKEYVRQEEYTEKLNALNLDSVALQKQVENLKTQNVKLGQTITVLNHDYTHNKNQLDEKITLIMNLEEELRLHETELDKLKTKHVRQEEYIEKLKVLNLNYDSLKKQVEDLKAQNKELDHNCTVNQKQLDEKITLIMNLEEQLRHNQTELDKLKTKHVRQEEYIEKLKVRKLDYDSLKKQVEDLKAQNKKLNHNCTVNQTQLDEKITLIINLEDQLRHNQTELDKLKTKHVRQEEYIEKLKVLNLDNDSLKKQVEDLKAQNKELNHNRTVNQKQLDEKITLIMNLEEQLRHNQMELDKLKTKHVRQEEYIEKLKVLNLDYDSLTKQVENLKAQNKELDHNCTVNQKQLDEKITLIMNLEEQLRLHQMDSDKLRTKYVRQEEYVEKLKVVNLDYDSLKKHVEDLKAQNVKLEQTITILQEEGNSFQRNINKLEQQIENDKNKDLQKQNQELLDNIDKLTNQIEMLNAKINTSKIENRKLEKHVAALQEELGNVRESNQVREEMLQDRWEDLKRDNEKFKTETEETKHKLMAKYTKQLTYVNYLKIKLKYFESQINKLLSLTTVDEINEALTEYNSIISHYNHLLQIACTFSKDKVVINEHLLQIHLTYVFEKFPNLQKFELVNSKENIIKQIADVVEMLRDNNCLEHIEPLIIFWEHLEDTEQMDQQQSIQKIIAQKFKYIDHLKFILCKLNSETENNAAIQELQYKISNLNLIEKICISTQTDDLIPEMQLQFNKRRTSPEHGIPSDLLPKERRTQKIRDIHNKNRLISLTLADYELLEQNSQKYQDEIKGQQEEIEELNVTLEELKADNNKLNEKIKLLKNEIENYKNTNDLIKQLEDLNITNKTLNDEVEYFMKDNQLLNDRIKKLEEVEPKYLEMKKSFDQLLQSNQKLKAIVQKYHNEVKKQTIKNSELTDTVTKVQNQLDIANKHDECSKCQMWKAKLEKESEALMNQKKENATLQIKVFNLQNESRYDKENIHYLETSIDNLKRTIPEMRSVAVECTLQCEELESHKKNFKSLNEKYCMLKGIADYRKKEISELRNELKKYQLPK